MFVFTGSIHLLLSDSMGKNVQLPHTTTSSHPGKDTFWFRKNFHTLQIRVPDYRNDSSVILLQVGTVDVLNIEKHGILTANSSKARKLRLAVEVKESILELLSLIICVSYNHSG